MQQLGQRFGHERRRQPLGQLHQPGAAIVEAVAPGLDRTAARHEFLDLRPAFVGARIERLDVRVLGQQQLVLFAQPVGVPVGGLGVDLAPLRVLLADRLARGRAVAPLLALGGDVVGDAAGLLVGVFGGGEFECQRVDLGGDVTLVQVLGLLDGLAVVLDREPVGVLVQPGVGDRAAEAGEHVGGVDADVIAGVGDDVDGLGRARMRGVDGEQLARQRVRLGVDGFGAAGTWRAHGAAAAGRACRSR